jgi:hypothetical protein
MPVVNPTADKKLAAAITALYLTRYCTYLYGKDDFQEWIFNSNACTCVFGRCITFQTTHFIMSSSEQVL